MPKLGEIKLGIDIGLKTDEHRFIWHACINCGKERWVQFSVRKKKIKSMLCHKCGCRSIHRKQYLGGNPHPWTDEQKKERQMSGHPLWKGGKIFNYGYVLIKLALNDPFYPMCRTRGYVLEHRLIMAKHLKRFLSPTEGVHHINGIRDDNRIENLKLISPANHTLVTELCSDCVLRKEVRLLRFELRQMREQLQGKLVSQ